MMGSIGRFPGVPGYNAYRSSLQGPAETEKKALEAAKLQKKARFQSRLAEVTAHENAHASRGAGFAGSPVIIADEASGHVSGYVPISVRFGKTADEALQNAQNIAAAALAPASPSSHDVALAASVLSQGAQIASARRAEEKAIKDQQEKQHNKTNAFSNPRFKLPQQNPFALSNPMPPSGNIPFKKQPFPLPSYRPISNHPPS